MGQQSIDGLDYSEIIYELGINDPAEPTKPENQ